MMRRRRLRFGAGYSMALAIVAVTILALGVGATLFFSGSQTRSMKGSLARWKARSYAISGLKAAADRLRQGRWYGSGAYVGLMGPADVGLGGTDVNFTVVCEDIRRFKTGVTVDGSEYDKFAVLDHIDVFSRGECDDAVHVAYARLILSPEPALAGTSTDGLEAQRGQPGVLAAAPSTIKRLVRISDFIGTEYHDIDQQPVRDLIRTKFRALSDDYRQNYAAVDWDANPAPPAGDRTSDGSALDYLREFLRSTPAAHTTNDFINDRLYDFILENTGAFDRATADRQRTIELEIDTVSGDRGFIEAACAATGTEVAHPEVGRVDEFPTPDAMDRLHTHTGAGGLVGSDDYRHTLCYDPDAQVQYTVSWQATSNATNAAEARSETGVGGGAIMQYGGLWYVGLSVEGPTPVEKPYWLDDPASGSNDLRMDSLAGFWVKYFDDGDAQPTGGYVKNGGNLGNVPAGSGDGGGSSTGSGGTVAGGW